MSGSANPVRVALPLQLSPEQIQAVFTDPETRPANQLDWELKLGWLRCAYRVLVKSSLEKEVSDV